MAQVKLRGSKMAQVKPGGEGRGGQDDTLSNSLCMFLTVASCMQYFPLLCIWRSRVLCSRWLRASKASRPINSNHACMRQSHMDGALTMTQALGRILERRHLRTIKRL